MIIAAEEPHELGQDACSSEAESLPGLHLTIPACDLRCDRCRLPKLVLGSTAAALESSAHRARPSLDSSSVGNEKQRLAGFVALMPQARQASR